MEMHLLSFKRHYYQNVMSTTGDISVNRSFDKFAIQITLAMTRGGSVYIMTNKLKTTLYIGVTVDLYTRIRQHKEHYFTNSFTDKYNLEYCVYYENFFSIEEAILREKQLKKWSRIKKENLINATNPQWEDLWVKIQYW
jgi:putative endonuclease